MHTTERYVENSFLISQSLYKCVFNPRAVQLCIHCEAMHTKYFHLDCKICNCSKNDMEFQVV